MIGIIRSGINVAQHELSLVSNNLANAKTNLLLDELVSSLSVLIKLNPINVSISPWTSALTELKSAHAAKDLSVIDSAMEKLNTAFQAASQDMYQASNENGKDGADQDSNTGGDKKGKSDEEVTDVDFEEV